MPTKNLEMIIISNDFAVRLSNASSELEKRNTLFSNIVFFLGKKNITGQTIKNDFLLKIHCILNLIHILIK